MLHKADYANVYELQEIRKWVSKTFKPRNRFLVAITIISNKIRRRIKMLDRLYKGHRWTNDEVKLLMKLWASQTDVKEIALQLNSTPGAIGKMVTRLRQNGIPLEKRNRGNSTGKCGKLWTQPEVEYLVRRRKERATAEEIAGELERTYSSINAMIQKLRSEEVCVERFGQGVRRKWSSVLLNATFSEAV